MLTTTHRVYSADARDLGAIDDGTVALVVTSPPYPMVAMWDATFGAIDPDIGRDLTDEDGSAAFDGMHAVLDAVWRECFRVLRPGGLACVNIGDATRSLAGRFQLYPNHARILMGLMAAGFSPLPDILWRKPTNAPNKFMGSGMLPPGAYVTYEHEYVLIARKGAPRAFSSPADKALRRRSAYFWEERNAWFSDLWEGLPGARQAAPKADRARSAAFPFALPYRLIHMFSVQGDRVLDPFAGTGTTMAAALAAGRSSVGVEHDPSFVAIIDSAMDAAVGLGQAEARRRLAAHRVFVEDRLALGGTLKHHNAPHDVSVITGQERTLTLLAPLATHVGADGVRRAEHMQLEHLPLEADACPDADPRQLRLL